MNIRLAAFALLTLLGASSPRLAGQAEPPLTAVWTATDGIVSPESAYYDPVSRFIYSSQVVGPLDAIDGNGRIVKLDLAGKVVSKDWAAGLNGPKGLRACNGVLWVSDIRDLVGFDVATGRLHARTPIAGAQFLNDVACAGEDVYVSDMAANKIWHVRAGKATVFVEAAPLDYPNGILVDRGRLVVGGWGTPPASRVSDVTGHLIAFDLTTKAATPVTPHAVGHVDGLESDGAGGYLIADPVASALVRVTAAGKVTTIAKFKSGVTDFSLAPDAGLIIAPHMGENQIVAYRLPARF